MLPPGMMPQAGDGKPKAAKLAEAPLGEGPEMLQEHWMKHFCEREELKQLQAWMHEEGLSRPRGFEARLEHGERLRALTEKWYEKKDYRRALHCAMCGVHALDFTPQEQMNQDEEQKLLCIRGMLPILDLAAKVFMMRGDLVNAEKATTAGLKVCTKLPDEETLQLRRDLHFNRGLVRGNPGQVRDLDGAKEDLVAAARLDPKSREIRECLANCKELLKEQQKQSNDTLKYRPPGEKTKKEEAPAKADGEAPAPASKPRELSATELKFAEVVGRSMGRGLRCCRRAKQAVQPGLDVAAKSPRLAVATASVPVLGLLAHFFLKP